MKRLDQKGAAAILSVVIFSIIITVVVTAYIRSAISGQAEALNFDLSTRAYYSAESGIQDALREISTNPGYTGKTECGDFKPTGSTGKLDATGYLAYTCQLIDTTPSSIEFSVGQDSNGMARLLPAVMTDLSGTYDLVIRWSSKNDAVKQELGIRDAADTSFTSQEKWITGEGYKIHPALRAAIISYPLNKSTFVGGDLKQSVFFLNPVSQSAGGGLVPLNISTPPTPDKAVQAARCYDHRNGNTFDGYLCEQRIRLTGYQLSSFALFARLHSLYGTTAVQLSLTPEGSNNKVPLTGSVIQIDVTGKAGNTFKRVRQTFNLNNGVIMDNLPEAAVIGGDGICKHYSITDQVSGFEDLRDCFN